MSKLLLRARRRRRLESAQLLAYERALAEAERWVARHVPRAAPWPQQVIAALAALIEFSAAAPREARLVLLEAQWAGARCFARHQAALAAAGEHLRPGRRLAARPERLHDQLEYLTATGVVCLLANHLQSGEPRGEKRLLRDLTDFVLEPYLGEHRATSTPPAAPRGGAVDSGRRLARR